MGKLAVDKEFVTRNGDGRLTLAQTMAGDTGKNKNDNEQSQVFSFHDTCLPNGLDTNCFTSFQPGKGFVHMLSNNNLGLIKNSPVGITLPCIKKPLLVFVLEIFVNKLFTKKYYEF